MPGGDRTGPMGMGPMTGRGAGYCAGFDMPGYASPAPGRGYGMGFGRGRGGWCRRGKGQSFGTGGRGRRNMFYATGLPGWMRAGWCGVPYASPTPSRKADLTMERKALRNQARALGEELDFIKKRLGEIEAERSPE